MHAQLRRAVAGAAMSCCLCSPGLPARLQLLLQLDDDDRLLFVPRRDVGVSRERRVHKPAFVGFDSVFFAKVCGVAVKVGGRNTHQIGKSCLLRVYPSKW